MSSCFENGGVSGVVAYDSLLDVRQKTGCLVRELVK